MHNTTNNKTAPRNGTASKTPRAHYKQSGSFNKLSIALWRVAYCLELARQDHADAGHLWRQAGCCIALSFFRMIGGRV